MDYSLKNLLNQTCTIYPFQSRNEYNEPTYSTPMTVACRATYRFYTNHTNNQHVSVSQHVVYFDKTVTIAKFDKLVIDNVNYYVEDFKKLYDEDGNHYHTVVTI